MTYLPCSFPDCNKQRAGKKDFCKGHQKQVRKGQPLRPFYWRRGPNKVHIEGDFAWLILTDMKGVETARTVIDMADLGRVQEHRWSLHDKRKSYVSAISAGEHYLHRFLLQPPDEMDVDHWDGNPLNNRRSNLHLVTQKLNRQNINRRDYPRGVYDRTGPRGPSWVVQVRGKYGGRFHSLEEAVEKAKAMRADLLENVNEERH